MATQLFAKSEQQLDTYLPAYKNILSATGWVDLNTGETKALSAEQKLVWLYVLDRYKFFTDDKRAYFDNQVDIGEACGVSESTVKRFFRALRKAGYLTAHETRIGGHKSNSYVIHRDLVLVQEDKKIAPVQTTEQPQQPVQAPQVHEVPKDDDFIPGGAEWVAEAVPMDVYDDFLPEFKDDGSYAESLAYSEQGEVLALDIVVPTPEAEAPAKSKGVMPSGMPDKRFKPNGDVSDEMQKWCDANSIEIIEGDWDVNFVINGVHHLIGKEGFEPCFDPKKPITKSTAIVEMESPF